MRPAAIVVSTGMTPKIVVWIGVLLLAAGLGPVARGVSGAPPAEGDDAPVVGKGAAPGGPQGPGGFVPRGSRRNFYAAAGGRLWYYMNNYYWVSETAPLEDLWIKTEVVESFHELRRWPDGVAVDGPTPKVTVEYWAVGSTRRSVRLDNHKDFILLSDRYTAGVISVEVTLTLGRLEVREEGKPWGPPKDHYVLESRNYSHVEGTGIGSNRTRFRALPSEAVNVWGYRVPWDTHPQRLTRSSWQRLSLPEWQLRERRDPPARSPSAEPVLTPSSTEPTER